MIPPLPVFPRLLRRRIALLLFLQHVAQFLFVARHRFQYGFRLLRIDLTRLIRLLGRRTRRSFPRILFLLIFAGLLILLLLILFLLIFAGFLLILLLLIVFLILFPAKRFQSFLQMLFRFPVFAFALTLLRLFQFAAGFLRFLFKFALLQFPCLIAQFPRLIFRLLRFLTVLLILLLLILLLRILFLLILFLLILFLLILLLLLVVSLLRLAAGFLLKFFQLFDLFFEFLRIFSFMEEHLLIADGALRPGSCGEKQVFAIIGLGLIHGGKGKVDAFSGFIKLLAFEKFIGFGHAFARILMMERSEILICGGADCRIVFHGDGLFVFRPGCFRILAPVRLKSGVEMFACGFRCRFIRCCRFGEGGLFGLFLKFLRLRRGGEDEAEGKDRGF